MASPYTDRKKKQWEGSQFSSEGKLQKKDKLKVSESAVCPSKSHHLNIIESASTTYKM